MKSKIIQSILILTLAGLILVACTATSSYIPQECPIWSGITEGQCTFKLEKDTISSNSHKIFEFQTGQIAQISVINNEGVIVEGEDIVVFTEDGETFNHEEKRLLPGIYVIKLNQEVEKAKFQIRNPGPNFLTFNMTLVTPYVEETQTTE